MFRLTREVRLDLSGDSARERVVNRVINGHAGGEFPVRLGAWFALRVTLQGEPALESSYLCNVKDIDRAVREGASDILRQGIMRSAASAAIVTRIALALREKFPGETLRDVSLLLNPFSIIQAVMTELPMIRLSQRYEFSASHRLHNDKLGEAENKSVFGKCNNPRGHGHNYELQVTLAGVPDAAGMIIAAAELDQIVNNAVIEPLDHKHLNVEVEEFATMNPTVENIAAVIFRRLKPRFEKSRAGLASVTVWETPRTWCEYAE